MIVYVSEELLHIREELEKRGYKIINSLQNEACDAIICNLKNGGLKQLSIQSCINANGTLIVDSGSRTIDEIEYVINNRTYSSIF